MLISSPCKSSGRRWGIIPIFCSKQSSSKSSVQQCFPNEMNRSEQHMDGSFTNLTILDSMKHFLGFTGLLKCTSELVNKSVLTILIAERSKITESRANMFVTCIVCTSLNDMSHSL